MRLRSKVFSALFLFACAAAPAFGSLLYVTSGDGVTVTGEVEVYDSLTGQYLQTLINTNLTNPRGITSDGAGTLYVAEIGGVGTGKIKQFDSTTGSYLGDAKTGLNQPIQMDWHNGKLYYTTFLDGDSLLWQADPNNSFNAVVFAVAGVLGNAGYRSPDDFIFAPDGFLYISTQNTISKYNATTGAFIETVATGKRFRGLTWGADNTLYYTESTTGSNTVGQVGGSTINSLNIPRDIITNEIGTMIVAIRGNATSPFTPGTRLEKYSFSGSYSDAGFFDDGSGSLYMPTFMYIAEEASVPEPGTMALLATGFAALAIARRKRASKA